MRYAWRWTVLLLFLAPLLHAQTRVVLIDIDGSINPASAGHVHEQLERAGADGTHALILRLNTPGGLLQSTRAIVADLLAAPVPVVVYVAPGGAQAASAGAFITMAAHVAAMAPGSNIGAAHPITMGDGSNIADSTNIPLAKATNDAAAFARSIAAQRGRNVQWAEAFVRGSASLTEQEALERGVIDLVAGDVRSLLRQLDGRMVLLRGDSVRLRTAGARIEERGMSFSRELLNILSDPTVAYILLMLGIYGLFFELYNPGALFPGIAGGICIILALYAMNTLPVNYAGLALLLFGVILLLLEVKIVSHGLLSIGGVIALFLGSIMLIDTPPGADVLEISMTAIITVTLCTTAFFLFIVGKGMAAQRIAPRTGFEAMIGEQGVALDTLNPEGSVRVHGEIWKARALGAPILQGRRVIVRELREFRMFVEEISDNNSST